MSIIHILLDLNASHVTHNVPYVPICAKHPIYPLLKKCAALYGGVRVVDDVYRALGCRATYMKGRVHRGFIRIIHGTQCTPGCVGCAGSRRTEGARACPHDDDGRRTTTTTTDDDGRRCGVGMDDG